MLLQQELWLIIVGLVTTFVFKRTTRHHAPFGRMALWACIFSLIIGEFGMLSTLFFPSDLLGLLLTVFAALLGARFGAKRGSSTTTRQTKNTRKNKT